MGINEIYIYAQNKNIEIKFENLMHIEYIYILDSNILILNTKFKNLLPK